MNSKDDTSGSSNFCIWFDSKNKKEYYTVPITKYKIKIQNTKSSNFQHIVYSESYIPKISPQRNRPAYVKNQFKLTPINMESPYEERYGEFLIRFLNAGTDTFNGFYSDFLYKYGLELLKEYIPQKRLKGKTKLNISTDFETEDSFKRVAKELFLEAQEQLISLQQTFRNCVDYIYNINGNEYDRDTDKNVKLQGYALQFDMSKYTDNLHAIFNSLSIFKNDLIVVKYNDSNKFGGTQNNIKYKSNHLSNICFILLGDIVSNNIVIKSCKNCTRYFIPSIKVSEIYCDLPAFGSNSTCREMGARITYAQNIQEVEGLLLYRRTYQRRLMELSRNPNSTEEEKEQFKEWKKSAQAKIKELKKGTLTEKELNKWMKESIE